MTIFQHPLLHPSVELDAAIGTSCPFLSDDRPYRGNLYIITYLSGVILRPKLIQQYLGHSTPQGSVGTLTLREIIL